jgi:hypothetical protein
MRIINLDDGGGREGCKKNGEIEIGWGKERMSTRYLIIMLNVW